MVCDVAGRAVAAAVSLSSSLEPPFISVGQALSATRAGKALYRCSREALSARIRATGRRHRRVDVLGTQISLDVTEREGHEPYFLGVPYESALTALVCSAAASGRSSTSAPTRGTPPSCTPCGQRGGSSRSSPTLASGADLIANLRLNSVEDRVEVVGCAVSSHELAQTRLFLSSRGSGFSSLVPDVAPAAPDTFDASVEVAMTTLDAWLARTGVEPWLIRIDVEGAERLVLAGMERTFAVRPPPRWLWRRRRGVLRT